MHIHPFLEGNGRTSRLLSTLGLYRAGYDFKRLFTISEYYDRDRASFYKAIQSVRESDMDMTGWLEDFRRGPDPPGLRATVPGGPPALSAAGPEKDTGHRTARHRRGNASPVVPPGGAELIFATGLRQCLRHHHDRHCAMPWGRSGRGSMIDRLHRLHFRPLNSLHFLSVPLRHHVAPPEMSVPISVW
ncbi:MAG: Fic family protein [Acidobacteria bacterium]|nr:Fic family protein [Acidobacteriota bacterium]